MFWQSKQVSSPHLEALLSKKDVTVYELMDDEDILQECKNQNKKLLDYLTRPNVMDELVTLTTQNPSLELEERQRFRYPNIACELLTCDVPVLNEKLAGDEGLLLKLYSFIDTGEPLNPLLASFFSKTIGVLVCRATDQNWYSYQVTCLQVLEFLKSRQTCIGQLLHHLETSAIMDLVLKLVTQIEGSEMRQNILNWLDSEQLVQRLVTLLSPNMVPSRHSNAAELLADMINATRDNRKNSTERADPDPILYALESEDTVTLILETILVEEKSESSIVGGIHVLLELLKSKTNGIPIDGNGSNTNSLEETAENEQRLKISTAVIPFLEHLIQLLLNPPYTPAVKTTIGLLENPVGNTRLYVLKLITTLLALENPKILDKLVELDAFRILLDLFFKYSWNNFLHTQVQQSLGLALAASFSEDFVHIYEYVFIKCQLLERMLEAYDANDKKNGKVRQGYMGHVIEIANNIVAQCEKNNVLDNFFKTKLPEETLQKWQNLVSTELEAVNATQQTLANQMQEYSSDTHENTSEYNSYEQDAFAQQNQNLGSQYIENYGNRDEMFNDGEDNALFNGPNDQSNPMTFSLNDDEEQSNREEMFLKLYQYDEKSTLAEEEDEESQSGWHWSNDAQAADGSLETVIYKRDWSFSDQKKRRIRKKKCSRSSSSDEEDEEEENDAEEEEEGGASRSNMDVDEADPWESWPTTNQFSNTILQCANPWEENASSQQQPEGWANFGSFENTFSKWNSAEDAKSESVATSKGGAKGDAPPLWNSDFSGQSNWANFANFPNFDGALTISEENNEGKAEKEEQNPFERTFSDAASGDQGETKNVNSIVPGTDIATDVEVQRETAESVKLSDDDNANPVVVPEARLPESAESEESRGFGEIVENIVDSVKSLPNDSSTLVSSMENLASAARTVTAEDPQ